MRLRHIRGAEAVSYTHLERGINFGLDALCLVNHAHQLPDQDIPLLIHKPIAHVCQVQ